MDFLAAPFWDWVSTQLMKIKFVSKWLDKSPHTSDNREFLRHYVENSNQKSIWLPVTKQIILIGNYSGVSDIFRSFLNKLNTKGELIIIDAYFFHPPSGGREIGEYSRLVVEILDKHLFDLSTILFVTKEKYNIEVKESIFRAIKGVNPDIHLKNATSKEYHDRFWISNNRKSGFFTGTSLNSISMKYSSICVMDEEDVEVIVTTLYENQLLD